jgi:hypothetical protein
MIEVRTVIYRVDPANATIKLLINVNDPADVTEVL